MPDTSHSCFAVPSTPLSLFVNGLLTQRADVDANVEAVAKAVNCVSLIALFTHCRRVSLCTIREACYDTAPNEWNVILYSNIVLSLSVSAHCRKRNAFLVRYVRERFLFDLRHGDSTGGTS